MTTPTSKMREAIRDCAEDINYLSEDLWRNPTVSVEMAVQTLEKHLLPLVGAEAEPSSCGGSPGRPNRAFRSAAGDVWWHRPGTATYSDGGPHCCCLDSTEWDCLGCRDCAPGRVYTCEDAGWLEHAPVQKPTPPPEPVSEAARKTDEPTRREIEVWKNDFPKLMQFFQKHAVPSKSKASCLMCGWVDQSPDGPRARSTQHGELPNIYICKLCVEKVRSSDQVLSAETPKLSTFLEAGEKVCKEATEGPFHVEEDKNEQPCLYGKDGTWKALAVIRAQERVIEAQKHYLSWMPGAHSGDMQRAYFSICDAELALSQALENL